MEPLLEVRDIGKVFGNFPALSEVSLQLSAGSVHAVMGENGAGKSTLMKLIAGVFQPSAGAIRLRGQDVAWADPQQARSSGVSTIFQEFVLLPNLSVAENLFLGREPRTRFGLIDKAVMKRDAAAVLGKLGLAFDPDRMTSTLGVAEQQLVEIAKGVLKDADVFVFDEPTAALGDAEVERLFVLIRSLQKDGKGILYISHRLPEVFALADTVTVLKDGRHVRTDPIHAVTSESLVYAMVGRDLTQMFPARLERIDQRSTSALALREGVAPALAGPIDLDLRTREIVGLAGLEGQGQREITRTLFGAHPLAGGRIEVKGRPIALGSPREAMSHRIGLLPEDRKAEGLYPTLSVSDNIGASLMPERPLWRQNPSVKAEILKQIAALNVRLASPRQAISGLSGGNQQKALLARWLLRGVDVLICEEPTRGVDVGAKSEIYRLLRELADGGCAILVTSRELPELLGLCDRIVVIRSGRTVAEFRGREATEEAVMLAAVHGGTC